MSTSCTLLLILLQQFSSLSAICNVAVVVRFAATAAIATSTATAPPPFYEVSHEI